MNKKGTLNELNQIIWASQPAALSKQTDGLLRISPARPTLYRIIQAP